jgi:folate-binding protein YgfZ
VVTDETGLAATAIGGTDAEAFLHGQLSNDVKALRPGSGHWTSYNSPKGRMLATLFLARRASDAFVAIVAADLAEALHKRLAMFVLRSSVVIARPPGVTLVGVGGPHAGDAVLGALGIDAASGWASSSGGRDVVRFPDGRIVVIPSADVHASTYAALARSATPVGAPVWDWLGVRTGVPLVTAATSDQFVAQTANLDAIGGLDFRKGCYPGQEVVARMQYLGRLKERLFAYATPADAPAPGTRLYGAPFGEQAAGTVVNSAPSPGGGSVFLAVVQMAAADAGPLAIGTTEGPSAHREPLPYPVPAPAPARARPPR